MYIYIYIYIYVYIYIARWKAPWGDLATRGPEATNRLYSKRDPSPRIDPSVQEAWRQSGGKGALCV